MDPEDDLRQAEANMEAMDQEANIRQAEANMEAMDHEENIRRAEAAKKEAARLRSEIQALKTKVRKNELVRLAS
jgi:phage-related minor tail protein